MQFLRIVYIIIDSSGQDWTGYRTWIKNLQTKLDFRKIVW